MQEEHDVMNALREADLALARMREGLAELERSLEEQDELTGLISQCMLQVNLGSMQNPLPVTMKLMALNLPVWPDPSKNVDELENARDREAAKAEEILKGIEESAAQCEEWQKSAVEGSI